MKQVEWSVWLNGRHIETVFFDADCTRDYVYRALTDHDGYHSLIKIRRVIR